MFDKIAENLSIIFKDGRTKEFAKSSVENIAKICLLDDLKSGVKETEAIVKYASSMKDIFFWTKIKRWLEDTCQEPEMEVKLATKFNEDEPKYREYAKRQIQNINEIDEDDKIKYYANLTRAWLMGYIDISVYFKIAYLLRVFTVEELEYLSENYKEDEFTEVNFYIKEFERYGLVDILQETNLGNSVYRYSNLAKVFLAVSLQYEKQCIDFHNMGLSDLKVVNTRTGMEITEF